MKLIIDIPDKKYEWIKEDTLCYTDEISEAIRQGISLEDIKAEIEIEIEDCIPAQEHDAWWNGKKYGLETALDILDKHIKENKQ